MRHRLTLLSWFAMLAVAIPAAAQETRASEIARKQAEKAQHLHKREPSRREQVITRLEKILVAVPPPVTVFVGSVFPGESLAFGPAFHASVRDGGLVTAHAGWSLANYKGAFAEFTSPSFGGGRFRVEANGSFVDAPRVRFYGVGNASAPADETTALYRPSTFGADLVVKPRHWLSFGGGGGYLHIATGPGHRGVSIEERFSPAAQVPGLGTDATFAIARSFVAVDWRESPGYTTSGGLYRVDWNTYAARAGGNFDSSRLDAQINQFIPVLRANWVIALRALASLTYTSNGNEVPYYMMPSLGGGSALRGFHTFRFRDRNRLLLAGEYRWRPSRFLDLALFYEAGKVASRPGDLDLDDLHRDYGIGARIHVSNNTPLRLDVAHSREGNRLVISVGQPF